MNTKRWEEEIKNKLKEHSPDHPQAAWNDFLPHLMAEDAIIQPEESTIQQSLDTYSPDSPITGWDRIESTLNESENHFDNTIRERIKQFHAAESNTWHNFSTYWSHQRHLRSHLIGLKLIEAAFLFLLLFAFVNLTEHGNPFNRLKKQDHIASSDKLTLQLNPNVASTLTPINQPDVQTIQHSPLGSNNDLTTQFISNKPTQSTSHSTYTSEQQKNNRLITTASTNTTSTDASTPSTDHIDYADQFSSINTSASKQGYQTSLTILNDDVAIGDLQTFNFSDHSPQQIYPPVVPIATHTSSLMYTPEHVSFSATPNTKKKARITFGIVGQTDYTGLRIAEDVVSSFGSQIVFPSKRLFTLGYGGGFLLSFIKNHFAFETGLMYNSKTFNPGRQIAFGSTSNRGSVDFQAMNMQILTLPLMTRYTFNPDKRIQPFAISGIGFNLVAKLDMDVVSRYHFAALALGEDPSSNPHYLQTIQESQRIREGILDGEPFSSKNYLTANIGAGLEYKILNYRSLFIQGIFQYQIPNLNFSNNKGKDLRAIAIQAGIRTTLGY